MITGFPAPIGNFRDQVQGKIVGIRDLNRTLAVSASRLIQFFGKESDCFRTGIQADMFLVCCEMNDIVAVPPGRHGPRDPLCRIRQFFSDGFSDALKLSSDALILREDIFIYCCRSLTAVMALVFIGESTSALRAFPHHALPPGNLFSCLSFNHSV